MTAMGTTTLLAEPLRWVWAGAFTVALALHLWHVRRMTGAHRLWHGGHAFMAAAMACMVVPDELRTTSAPLWVIGTGGAAGAVLVYALLRRWDGGSVGIPWITLGIGLAGTAYMWLMTAGLAVAPLTYAAAAWLVCESLGWFAGALGRHDAAAPRLVPAAQQRLAPATTTADRVTLGMLALGMAYLFVAMQHLPMGH